MIELTVKTLDSQNHAFSVPDDTTVKQLKEKIAESISFPVDSQRLIYCGRVLQDDKNLSEYDVNGKVIHLVQRPPPQASRPNGGQGGTRTGSGGQQRRANHHFRQPRIDGNAMYLGAMAFPADLMDAQGIQAPPSSHNLSLSRLVLARRMLRKATAVLNRLENPPSQEGNGTDTPPEEAENASGSNGENGASGSNSAPSGMPFSGRIAQAAQAATAAAIAAAVSAAHAAGVPNITIVRGGQQQGEPETVNFQLGGTVNDDVVVADQEVTVTTSEATTDAPMPDVSSPPETSEPQTATQGSSTDAEASTASEAAGATAPPAGAAANNEERPSRSFEPPRTSRMAELLDELANVNRRLQPFMAQYHQLMQDDPTYEANASTIQESQRVFSMVSEIMHYLSHAYHALSDIMCDFSQTPPRSLRCRPVLIQHSAVLQAGIPIQAQINVMANRGNSNSSSNYTAEQENASRGSSTGPTSTEASTETTPVTTAAAASQTAAPVATSTNNTSPSSMPAESSQPQANGQDQRPRVQLGTGSEATFNITPGNVEFFMEVGPGSITIDSLEATVVTNGNASGMGSSGIEANVVGGSFPWGSPPPPEFIQNLMQAVAGHMIGRGVGGTSNNGGTQSQPAASTGSTTTTTTAAATAGTATGVGAGTGQNSQARGNTATHPTTATQTRSTSRPHVHLAPAMQGLGASNFDPFLPCNSHHIRSRTRHNLHPFQQHFVANVEPSIRSQTATTTSATAPSDTNQGEEGRSSASAAPQTEQDTSASSQVQPEPQAVPQSRPFVMVHTRSPMQQRNQDLPNQQQATPQPPSQSQAPPQAQQAPNEQAAQNLFDLISNMFTNMPSSAATSINFGAMYQSVPLASSQSRTQSSSNPSRSTSTASSSAGASPGMAFYTSMLNGQGSTGTAAENNPFNPFAEMFEGLTGALGEALRGQGQGSTLADFLHAIPDRPYTEGNSLFIDFMMTLAGSMTFQDIFALSFASPEVVNRLRPQLREFVGQRVLQGEPITEENMSRGVDRLLRELRPYLDVMLQARLREDVDLITTTVRYNQIRIPEAIRLIMAEGNEAVFGRQMVQWCTTYIKELTAIIRHCCLDNMQGLDMIMRNYVQQLTSGVHPSLQQWTVNSSLVHMRNYISHQNVPLEDIQRFLVYRIQSVSPSPGTEESSAAAQHIPETARGAEAVNSESRPEPMEMDTSIGEPQANPLLPSLETLTSTLAMDTETLPDVVLGSEAWHNVLPSEWVPIITRDTQRQRRQSTQPAFSDAYLSGMPSKRRKVVTSAKPQGNMSQIITESVRRSLDDAGVRPVSGIETAGDDLELQAAYREQMRSSVQQTLINNPDFTPDRFPNATKYFAK